MKLSLAFFYLIVNVSSCGAHGARTLKSTKVDKSTKAQKSHKAEKSAKATKGNKASKSSKKAKDVLPEIGSLMNTAFPMWDVDSEGARIGTTACSPESCQWNPFYVTKRYDGLHPKYGGHPTDIDVNYAFFGGSPFGGQPYQGTPHHCNTCDNDDIKISECPKIETLNDDGPYGPGHVPPHIALASLSWTVQNKGLSTKDMFDYEKYNCRVIPDVLFDMIRSYFPRVDGEKVKYPPPITAEGGDFQYEFPAGNGIDNQEPPYKPGPPHWCEEDFGGSGHWDGVCPYIFKGPDAGKYRHPHIAYAALEVYLANKLMPETCHTTWLENNPEFLDETRVTTDTPFPEMDNDAADDTTIENWIGQPVIPWNYVSGTSKAVPGLFATDFLFADKCL